MLVLFSSALFETFFSTMPSGKKQKVIQQQLRRQKARIQQETRVWFNRIEQPLREKAVAEVAVSELTGKARKTLLTKHRVRKHRAIMSFASQRAEGDLKDDDVLKVVQETVQEIIAEEESKDLDTISFHGFEKPYSDEMIANAETTQLKLFYIDENRLELDNHRARERHHNLQVLKKDAHRTQRDRERTEQERIRATRADNHEMNEMMRESGQKLNEIESESRKRLVSRQALRQASFPQPETYSSTRYTPQHTPQRTPQREASLRTPAESIDQVPKETPT